MGIHRNRTRDEVIDQLNEIIVVPATRTIRGISSEVVLTPEDGMPVACALNPSAGCLFRDF